MSRPVIKVRELGKAYQIGRARERADSLKESLSSWFRGLVAPAEESSSTDTFWALRHASFDVQAGEVVGIIGRNGAGKSTLLKLLSRIVEPTEGEARMRGRVSSLLEVGTGFHPELTGRENVYLNGSILGMPQREIRRKFDSIVEFSEIGKFLDTPVKRYSSGMYVRLAFAVAAHLDPQIMIVDEVLAVGDAAFQKKCLGKMNDVVREGRTILFVSHSMDAVAGLCKKAIVVAGGRAGEMVDVDVGIRQYMEGGGANLPLIDKPRTQDKKRPPIFHTLQISTGGESTAIIPCGGGATFTIGLNGFGDEPGTLTCGLALLNERGQRVVLFHSLYHSEFTFKGAAEMNLTCDVPQLPLTPGKYTVELVLADGHGRIIERVEHAGEVDVVFRDLLGTGKLPNYNQSTVVLPAQWS